jgi:abequosyltransferase
MENLFLSICIPTNGRIEIIKNTLDSIYNDCKVPFSEFEVVLSDNSTNDELFKLLEFYKEYPNIVYEKTNCEGFLNSINALTVGKGKFLKLHNNYTMFTTDGLEKLISFIKHEYINKPVVFFKNSEKNKITNYDSFDRFCSDLSFWNSWSTGFSTWKTDFDEAEKSNLNIMFPHTSLLLLQYSKMNFVINDEVYFTNQNVPKKGGYNLFRVFAVTYLKMMEDQKIIGNLSTKTFLKIKKDLFFDFLISWYCNTKLFKNEYTFDLEDIKESVSVYYGTNGFYKLKLLSYIYFFKSQLVKNLKVYKNNEKERG